MIRIFGRKPAPMYIADIGHLIKQFNPLDGQARPDTLFLSIPERDILTLVERYIAAMETEESAEWCRCEWVIHPDDVHVKKGNCRECNQPPKADVHSVDMDPDIHKFKGKRMRRGDTDATCPVHTREGLIIYFFEWIFTDAARS